MNLIRGVPFLQEYLDAIYPGMGYTAGLNSYGDPRILSWGEGQKFHAGNFCSIGSEVSIFLGGNHRTDWITTFPFSALDPEAVSIPGHPHSRGDVLLGHDVWLGQGSAILSGVKIGNGACVSAYAVVTKDVPDYAIVAGNPAKIRRWRFTPQQIERLLLVKWWDWPEETIQKHYPLLLSKNIDEFLDVGETLNGRPAIKRRQGLGAKVDRQFALLKSLWITWVFGHKNGPGNLN